MSGPERIELIETFAFDFTRRVTDKTSYEGLTAEQILTGWLFYYDEWKYEPMIEVKDARIREALGIEGDKAALSDFFSADGYKLAGFDCNAAMADECRRLDEIVALISSVATGKAFIIFPVKTGEDNAPVWISWVDISDHDLSMEDWEYVQTRHSSLFSHIASGRFRAADDVISDIRTRQYASLPDSARVIASSEKTLNVIQRMIFPLAIAVLLSAMMAMILAVKYIAEIEPASWKRALIAGRYVGTGVEAAGLLYSLLMLVLRAIVGRHWPLSDGYETLVFLAALTFVLSLGACMWKKSYLALGAGLLIGGFSLLVAGIVTPSPRVTHLVPVLSSAWLSVHVMLVMAAYSLMAFMAVIGCVGIRKALAKDVSARLARMNYVLLVPAVFLLLLGILSGSVWASQSWGRYWGWDPKEVCALVTLLIYAVPLHSSLLRRETGRRFDMGVTTSPRRFNGYLAISILAVLFTYFGANYFLSGLHSYA